MCRCLRNNLDQKCYARKVNFGELRNALFRQRLGLFSLFKGSLVSLMVAKAA